MQSPRMRLPYILKPANTLVFNGTEGKSVSAVPCFFMGFLLGLDGSNDPTVTIYDNTTNSGNEIIPSNTYDASALGLNGAVLPHPRYCQNGVYAYVSQGAGGVTKLEPLLLTIFAGDEGVLISDIKEALG